MFYNQPLGIRFGSQLIRIIQSGEWEKIDIAVAWVRESGMRHIYRPLSDYLSNGHQLRVVAGVDLENTTKEGLQRLVDLEQFGKVESFVHHNEANGVFHPKIYLFRNDENAKLIVASNNLTESGLFVNTEACLEFDTKLNDKRIKEALDAFDAWCDTSSGLAVCLTDAVLKSLHQNAYISSESKLSRKFTKKSAKQKKAKKVKMFASIFTSPPKLQKKVASKKAVKKSISKKAAATKSLPVDSSQVLIMRIRTSRGTQTQIPMAVIRSSFFKGISNVTSQHTGENHGIHEAKARGSVNTLKLEIPETRSMNDPVVRFEKTGSKIFYEVYDSPSPRGKILMQSLKNGLSITPKETFLTKPSSPLTSTWWRFT